MRWLRLRAQFPGFAVNTKVVPMPSADIKRLAERMMRVFVGNASWHYTANFKNVTIESGGKRVPKYEDVEGPPSLQEFIDHLSGKKGLLVIPITKAGACRWGKIDIDEYPTNPTKWAKAIARWGLPLVVELTKSGGVHLGHYCPYTESATDMREKLSDWAASVHAPPKAEIFPKQEKLMDGEPGSGINLPYFGGDSESTKNYAIDAEGNRLTVDAWLTIIENMPARAKHTPGAVNVEAACEILSKHWTDGQRDNLNMAVAGTLLRAGLDVDVVQQILDGSSDIAADDAERKTAEFVEKSIAEDKRVPGYNKLVEIIGEEDARELMRLAGAKPPPEPIPFNFISNHEREWRTEEPPQLTYTIEPILPSGVVGMLVAEGGTGKTVFAMRMAMAVASGRDFFGLKTKIGPCVYIACEEHERSLRRRYHWQVRQETERMRIEGLSQDAINDFHAAIDANMVIRSAVGYELFLVSARNGETTQTAFVDALIDKLPRPLELLVLDPISRLNGGEENSNMVGTALVNAAERIARERECTVLLCHHTGKAAAKDRETGLYAARGASGFVDAARSSIRLLQADANDVKSFTNVPDGIVAAGDLVQVIHNKSNEGPKAKPFWIRRQALDFELFEPKTRVGGVGDRDAELIGALYGWFVGVNKNAGFSPSWCNDVELLREMFKPFKIDKSKAKSVIDRARHGENPPIVESDEKAPRSQYKLLKFRAISMSRCDLSRAQPRPQLTYSGLGRTGKSPKADRLHPPWGTSLDTAEVELRPLETNETHQFDAAPSDLGRPRPLAHVASARVLPRACNQRTRRGPKLTRSHEPETGLKEAL